MTTTRSESPTASSQVVRDEQDGGPVRGPQLEQVVLHQRAGLHVQGAEGFVHEDDPRLVGERRGDRDPLAHAAGELVRVRVGEVRQADPAEPFPRGRERGGLVLTPVAQGQRDVLDGGAPRQQRVALEDEADVGIDARDRLPNVSTVPRSGFARPASRSSSVDLPHPDGPTTDTNSPCATSRSTSEMAVNGRPERTNVRVTPEMRIAGTAVESQVGSAARGIRAGARPDVGADVGADARADVGGGDARHRVLLSEGRVAAHLWPSRASAPPRRARARSATRLRFGMSPPLGQARGATGGGGSRVTGGTDRRDAAP